MDEADKRAHHDPKRKSIIQDIFAGECRQSITCDMDDCGHVSHTSQAFTDLSLDLLTRERDIMSSLQDFTRQETLSYDNQYKCEKYTLAVTWIDLIDAIPSPGRRRLRRYMLRRRFCRSILNVSRQQEFVKIQVSLIILKYWT